MEKSQSLKDDVRNKIITEILRGNFPVDSVITEKQLIEMFNVSKTTIREALVELRNENVLQSMPRYGYRIIQLNKKDIDDALEVRTLLELSGLEKTITTLNQDKIEQLKACLDQCDPANNESDLWTHWNNNVQFHLQLNSLAGNEWMQSLLDKTMKILSRAYAQSYWKQWGSRVTSLDTDTHRKILELLENEEYELAKATLKEDILKLEI